MMTHRDKVILSAMFSRTNMGQQPSSQETVNELMRDKMPLRLENVVIQLCEDLIESDEHVDIFIEEATEWKKTLDGMDDEAIRRVWPDRVAQIDAARESS